MIVYLMWSPDGTTNKFNGKQRTSTESRDLFQTMLAHCLNIEPASGERLSFAGETDHCLLETL